MKGSILTFMMNPIVAMIIMLTIAIIVATIVFGMDSGGLIDGFKSLSPSS